MNETLPPPAAPRPAGMPAPLKIAASVMIVDDDPTTTDLIQGQLSDLGFQNVLVCTDSRQALPRLEAFRPDVLLLDILMPHVGGLEILESLRTTAGWPHLPVIILTVVDDFATRIRALELGATDFLNKPVNSAELACRIRNAAVVNDYRTRLEHQARDLRRQVDQQTASLRESYAELERVNGALRRSCEAAEAATEAKSRFLANVSHEIRTPLTAIIGFTEELLDGAGQADLAPRAPEMLQVIHRNGRHLLQLVNDLLDVSTIEKGRLKVEPVSCSPAEVLTEVVRLIEPQARAKGLDLSVAPTVSMPATIRTDPTRLRQILTNLIGNAVKFTDKGFIRVAAELIDAHTSSPRLQFEVTDTGIGIQADHLQEIFRPFSQVRRSTSGAAGGVGLGLTICRFLAEELGGRLDVESRPGGGSTFRATIATGRLEAVNTPDEPHGGMVRPTADPVTATGTLSGCRVLLAEDSIDNQRLIQAILMKAGATVLTVGDGQAALEAAMGDWHRGEAPDVILTDIQMPVLDGYELVDRLRAANYPGRIVALTANAAAGDREKCLAGGCDDYLSKPIDRHVLLSVVGRNAAR